MTRGPVRRFGSLRTGLVVLVVLGLLACVIADLSGHVGSSVRGLRLASSSMTSTDTSHVGRWEFASAHSNVQALVQFQQRYIHFPDDALLVMAQTSMPTWILILPLVGLLAATALVRFGRSRARATVLLSGLVPLAIGSWLVIQAHVLEIPQVWSSWSRVLVWLVVLDLYFVLFLLLGTWINLTLRSLRRAVWVLVGLFVVLFAIQGARPVLMRMDGAALPAVPELPTEVRLSLFRPSGEPRVTPDRVEMVDAYLQSVDAYSEAVHDVVRRRYNLERWWNAASPQLLLSEMAGQLLQNDYANTTDVIYTPSRRSPSLFASMGAIWPESAWLAAACCLVGWGVQTSSRKRGDPS